jgi:hypothetical protein
MRLRVVVAAIAPLALATVEVIVDDLGNPDCVSRR